MYLKSVAVVPWNLTTELGVNPNPSTVTVLPVGAPPGEKPEIDNDGVNVSVLVLVPAAVASVILPGAAPLGTRAWTCVASTGVSFGDAREPNLTEVAVPMFLPVIVIVEPVTLLAGVNPDTFGKSAGRIGESE